MHDENKLMKKKYKAGPTTQAEVRECSASLGGPAFSVLEMCGAVGFDDLVT